MGIEVVIVVALVGVAVGVGVWRERRRRRVEAIEARALELAEQRGGRVTVPILAARSEGAMEECESVLSELARAGHVRLEVGEDGEQQYVFAGLGEGASSSEDRQTGRSPIEQLQERATNDGVEMASSGSSGPVALERSVGQQKVAGRTAVGVIVDESASMEDFADEAICGYNEFLRRQKGLDAGEMTLTRTLFDGSAPPRIDQSRLEEAEPLDDDSYSPSGHTALLDAIGHTIAKMQGQIDRLPEGRKPSEVVVAVITDGEENASQEFSRSKVREMVEYQREVHGWEFLFIGAGIDDFADARDLGLSDNQLSRYPHSELGVREAYREVAAVTSETRLGAASRESSTSTTSSVGGSRGA